MFKVVSLKSIMIVIVLILISVILGVGVVQVVSISAVPRAEYVVVIDAGHGGIDGGSVGKTYGTIEKEINLEYANCLKDTLQQFGFEIIMTRSNDNGLYSNTAQNKKRDDMKKRKDIIQDSNADFVISIHMNSFPDTSVRGTETYFCNGSEVSEKLANCIQRKFYSYVPKAKQFAKSGEFFMLEQIDCPSVLIECGYISNPEEEKNLRDKTYMQTFCYNIFLGILDFLA